MRSRRRGSGSPRVERSNEVAPGVNTSNGFAVLGDQGDNSIAGFLLAAAGQAGGVVSSPSLTLNEYPILERQRPQ